MNSLLINCSHFSPDPLTRTNTVEAGGSCFYSPSGNLKQKWFTACYGFTVMAVKDFWLHERKWIGFDTWAWGKRITESSLSLMHPFLPIQKNPSNNNNEKSGVYDAACSQWRNRDLISRQEEGIHVQNTVQATTIDTISGKAVYIFIFSSEAGNTQSWWSLCILHPFLHMHTFVSLFTYINKLEIIYITVQNRSKLSYQNVYTCQWI